MMNNYNNVNLLALGWALKHERSYNVDFRLPVSKFLSELLMFLNLFTGYTDDLKLNHEPSSSDAKLSLI